MKKWIRVAIPVLAILVLAAWYAFRPERLVIDRSVNEAFPSGQGGSSPQSLVSGQFYSILHPTAGTATIYQMGDGSRLLRLTSFCTSNGPDVHVYMVAADDAKDVATVEKAGFVDLGHGNLRCRMHLLRQYSSRGILRGFGLICSRCSCFCAPNFGGGSGDGESLHAVLHGLGASKKLS